jgi:excinuclease ABC subunit B
MNGDDIEKISQINPVSGEALSNLVKIAIYPAKHFIADEAKVKSAIVTIKEELEERVAELKKQSKLLEAQRLEQRTKYDMEMLLEIGYCHGVENYSRALSGRPAGSRPYCLIDYFPKDFLTVIDESHVTVPQLHGMYNGDRARKETLVEFGFRLPSCLDNRPLRFNEFESLINQTIFVSATPNEYEIEKSGKVVVEQIIRPTGLIDPQILVRPTKGQIDDLIDEIRQRAARKERILITTLTKRMAEDLSRYLLDLNLRVKYIHSDINALDRVEILRDLRKGAFDTLIGVNLLREGLDLPEVSLVAVLDADKEGFLRSQTSLIQVAGRAARNINGMIIMYADTITGSMKRAISETKRRRKIQAEFNDKNKITPRGIEKAVKDYIERLEDARHLVQSQVEENVQDYEKSDLISELEQEMELAARNLQFERAAVLRDQIKELRKT